MAKEQEDLVLDERNLTELPPEIGQATEVQTLDLRGNQLTALPPEIGQLTNLQTLALEGNQLTALPAEIGQLTNLATLTLRGNRLGTLPAEIGRLANLAALNLRLNQLTALPAEIGQLTNLANLALERNQLTALPAEIGRLTNLAALNLRGNQLSVLPAEIGRLTNLATLDLDGNQLSVLPAEIGRLTNLAALNLRGNQLSVLPAEIGQLTNLATLVLQGNRLVALPAEIGRLINLRTLALQGNRLVALPAEIGQLTNLRTLYLRGNQLSVLPAEIGQLTNLANLYLEHTQLTALPTEIGQLTNLANLYLEGNQLTGLPAELGNLSANLLLRLGGNPLREPLPHLVDRGPPGLFTYLRSLKDGEPQYEAKLLLVGEGNVGKTSLVTAFKGEPFQDHPTNHGIKLAALVFAHPDQATNITLNSWDFGGQELYRITNQFFFSRRAVYLLVWQPRQGQEQNEVEGWLRRIRLRVGEDARVIVVATHADDHTPELDYPYLKKQFRDLLVGHCEVDNSTRTGIEELRDAVSVQAAKLPQMGEPVSRRWIAARGEILERPEPQIAYDKFVAICQGHGLDPEETGTLASLLHDLGHIIYYGEDEGLRDIVVLRPDWLTEAISYVLEDGPTRHAGGVLDHARLRKIWHGRYPDQYHPYFLRLMEKFDICYRISEEASLVAQLVPYEQPELPWLDPPERPGTRTLRLLCSMADAPPGLVACLTVRNHRFSIGLHWRSGVFLEHKAYASEALFELVDQRLLALTVRASSPDYLFNILRDSVEYLISQRWPALDYKLLVPCPTRKGDGTRCVGRFKFQNLLRRREQGDTQIRCEDCDERCDITLLLTGFATPSREFELDEILERLKELKAGMRRIETISADIADTVRRCLRAISTEVPDCPRFFTLVPTAESSWNPSRFWRHQYRLTLWCEHPGHCHPWPQASYDVTRPREWFNQTAPYLRLMSKMLRLVVPIASAVPDIIWSEVGRRGIQCMHALVEQLPEEDDHHDLAVPPESRLTGAQGAGLRELRALLFDELDPSKSFGGLRQRLDPSGDFLWVCPTHYPEYDPGLPDIP